MRTCTIEGCDRPSKTRGYCNLHYLRLQRGKDMNAPPQKHSKLYQTIGTPAIKDSALYLFGVRHSELAQYYCHTKMLFADALICHANREKGRNGCVDCERVIMPKEGTK